MLVQWQLLADLVSNKLSELACMSLLEDVLCESRKNA